MPFFAKINQSHFIQLDQLYPMLPGKIQVNLVGESKGRLVSLREGELSELLLRSIQVDLACSVSEWE